jgi:hypothetical protein
MNSPRIGSPSLTTMGAIRCSIKGGVVVATQMLDWLLGFSDKLRSPGAAQINSGCSPRPERISLARANPLYEVFFPA